jgi:endonuclease/exonuclease/phosphatase family metal-dependent hydrolase
LASLNLLHGRSLSDGEVVPARLATAARLLDADVVGLQEVDRGQRRSHGADQTAAFATAMGSADRRSVAEPPSGPAQRRCRRGRRVRPDRHRGR